MGNKPVRRARGRRARARAVAQGEAQTQTSDHAEDSVSLKSFDSFHSALSVIPPEPVFPYLDTTALHPADIERLEMQLIIDTKSMKKHFANFTHDIKRSLERLQIPLRKIKDTILSLDAFTDDSDVSILDSQDAERIESAPTIDHIFIVLRKYMSFFNYSEIMDYLVYQHGAAEDHERLEAYMSKFNDFCKRNVFEVPKNAFLKVSPRQGKVFAVKCTEQISTLNDVKAVRVRIAGILELDPIALQLSSVMKGCVELYFLVSAAVAERVFPVTPSQHSALSEIGVRVIDPQESRDTQDSQLAMSPSSLSDDAPVHNKKPLTEEEKKILFEKLFDVCGRGSLSEATSLVEQGAHVNGSIYTRPTQFGQSPLWTACKGGHTETAKMLIDHGAEVDKCNTFGQSPLRIACERGHTETAKLLIDHGAEVDKYDDDGRSPLWTACERGHTETAKLLIDRGVKVDKCDKYRRSPLWIACERGHTETAKLLIDRGAEVDKCDIYGQSPLWEACRRGHIEIVQLLMDCGADINKRKTFRNSPLMVAERNGHFNIVQLLEGSTNLVLEDPSSTAEASGVKASDELFQYKQYERQSSRAGSRAGSHHSSCGSAKSYAE